MNVILPIKPEYCKRIMRGSKRYEFRKRVFRQEINVDYIFMYSTSPVQKIVGVFTIESIIENHPRRLWEQFKEEAGIRKDAFFKYFGTRDRGFAIEVKDVVRLEPVDPRDFLPEFVPPQSFRYIEEKDLPLRQMKLRTER